MPVAGIDAPADMPLPEKLKLVQALMADGDDRAQQDLPDHRHLPRLRRRALRRRSTTFGTCSCSGASPPAPGGDDIVGGAREVLEVEFPSWPARSPSMFPTRHDKRHGQAIAAASLPAVGTVGRMNPYHRLVAELARLAREGRQLPLGGFPRPPRPTIAPGRAARPDLLAASRRRVHHRRAGAAAACAKPACASSTSPSRRAATRSGRRAGWTS